MKRPLSINQTKERARKRMHIIVMVVNLYGIYNVYVIILCSQAQNVLQSATLQGVQSFRDRSSDIPTRPEERREKME